MAEGPGFDPVLFEQELPAWATALVVRQRLPEDDRTLYWRAQAGDAQSKQVASRRVPARVVGLRRAREAGGVAEAVEPREQIAEVDAARVPGDADAAGGGVGTRVAPSRAPRRDSMRPAWVCCGACVALARACSKSSGSVRAT